MKLISLFSGCGGMDIGFEGNFSCLKKSINEELHPEWINSTENEWVTVSPTSFETIFANDIKPAVVHVDERSNIYNSTKIIHS